MRLGAFSELEGDEQPQTSIPKSISGNDKDIPARQCGNKNQIILRLMVKLLISTNEMIRSDDLAFLGRLLFFYFPNHFTPEDTTEEKKKEIEALDFASVLYKRANKFYQDNKQIQWGKLVLLYTQQELDKIDTLKTFFNNNYELTDSVKDTIHRGEIYEAYREFCADNFYKALGKIQFYSKFSENLVHKDLVSKIKYSHIKRKIINGDDDEDDEDDKPRPSLLRRV